MASEFPSVSIELQNHSPRIPSIAASVEAYWKQCAGRAKPRTVAHFQQAGTAIRWGRTGRSGAVNVESEGLLSSSTL